MAANETVIDIPQLLRRPNRVSFEDPNAVRKRGVAWKLRREVEAMDYVRSRTSVPVPTIIESHFNTDPKREGSILMERVPGVELGVAWAEMTVAARTETIEQLRAIFKQLHKIKPPDNVMIGSCSGGQAYDHRFDNPCGPFHTVGEFHDYLVAPIKLSPRPDWVEKYRPRLADTHEIRFAHADFSWENTMVDPETGRVTGILDWEMPGFWPAWWEYRKALYGARHRPWWIKIVKEVMDEYAEETEADFDLEMF